MAKKSKISGGSGLFTIVTEQDEALANVLKAVEDNGYYWSITMRVGEGGIICFDVELGKPI